MGYARSVASMNASGVSPHWLRAFVYVFRGEAEKTQIRQPHLLLEFQLTCAAFSRDGYLASLSRSPL